MREHQHRLRCPGPYRRSDAPGQRSQLQSPTTQRDSRRSHRVRRHRSSGDHFQRRKVAIGDCGRSYDTACIHEHSCLRCPLLRPDPAARARLEEIRDNLIARIAEAESHRWHGEAEGLKVSLAGANTKLAQMDQISASRTKTVQLGIPSFTDTAGRNTDSADDRNQF